MLFRSYLFYSCVGLSLAELLSAFALLEVDTVRRYPIAIALAHPFVHDRRFAWDRSGLTPSFRARVWRSELLVTLRKSSYLGLVLRAFVKVGDFDKNSDPC